MIRTDVIHPKNTTVSAFVAMGGYGKVFKGKYTQPATEDGPEEEIDVAIKRIHDYDNEMNDRCKRVGREIDILKKLKGNNEFIEPLHIYRAPADKNDQSLYIVMPFVPQTAHGVARNIELRQSADYVEVVVKLIIAQVLSGLQKMHAHQLYHRDMSSSNILVDLDNNFAYISDFGLSRASPLGGNEMLTPMVVTLPFRALELLLDPSAKGGYSPALLDLWGVGMIMWELLTGSSVQGTDEIKQAILIINTIFGGKVEFDFWKNYNNGSTRNATAFLEKNQAKLASGTAFPEHITSTSQACQDVLFKLLSQIPDKRGSAAEILDMPWFDDEYVKEALTFLRSNQPTSDIDYAQDVDPTAAFFDEIAPRLTEKEFQMTTIKHTSSKTLPSSAPLTQV